jgi:flavin-dependent dehydrogenase
VDVVVVGAGPAGCAAATVLAQCGHRVLLVDRPSTGRHTLAESIPPSANRLLIELGMKNAVDAAGFHPWLGNTVWWGSDEPRIEPFAAGEAGYQVDRARFDAVLRDVAARTGARIVSGTVRDVMILGLDPSFFETSVAATIETEGKATDVTARIVLDCSGRAGVVARKGLRQVEASHRTVALIGVWSPHVPWTAEQRGHTLVTSYGDGWAWSVPTSPGTRYVTVMVDPERSHLARGVSALDVYRAELKKVSAFGPLLEHATLVSGPWGADASLYGTERHAGPGFLLVGDAASFIDPLSSFGVKKALASGWLAGITANTILKTPAMRDEALAFFERRERAVVESLREQAARYAADAGDATNHPFWQARQGQFAGSEDPASEDDAVLAALADLRHRPEIHLEQGAQVRTGLRASIQGQVVAMNEHLFLPAWPDGVRYLRNIDLLLLMRLATEHRDVGALYDATLRAQPGASLPDLLGVLSTLIARGALQHSPCRPESKL